jgi:tRNA threonylcarbamoyladenosine biosynthesis protein TsaE
MRSDRCSTTLPADPAATERLGEWLGQRLGPGTVVGLVGELGAGKTTFVRGLARGLGTFDVDAVSSPTYLLVVEHPGRTPLVHADAYLPEKLEAFLADGGLDYLLDPRAVVAIEWAQRVAKFLPEATLWVELSTPPAGGRHVAVHTGAPAHFPWLHSLPKMGAVD